LGNETDLEIIEHTTDTGGYTDIIFALFDLLWLLFSPGYAILQTKVFAGLRAWI